MLWSACLGETMTLSHRHENPSQVSPEAPRHLPRALREVQEEQAAKCHETPQNDTVPPLLRSDPAYQSIDPWHLTRDTDDTPVDTRQRLPLHAKALVDGICLGQDTVDDAVAVVQSSSLGQHVLCLGVGGVGGAVRVDVRTDVGEEMLAVASFGDGGPQAAQLGAVFGEDLAVSRQVRLLERGRGEVGGGIE